MEDLKRFRKETLVESPWMLLQAEKEAGIVIAYWKNGKRLNYTLLGGKP